MTRTTVIRTTVALVLVVGTAVQGFAPRTAPRVASVQPTSRLVVAKQSAFPGDLEGSAPSVPNASKFWKKTVKKIVSKAKPTTDSHNQAPSVASSTMNLIKVILGTGALALPAGLAAVSDCPKALWPATVFMTALGMLNGYTFNLYGRLCHATQAKTTGELWEKCKGKDSSWVISLATLTFCFGVALTYSLVIGDFLSSLAMSYGGAVPALMATRQFWILSVAMTTLLPLCNLKSLASLAPMSVLGTVGTILTTIFMGLRCPSLFPGSPYRVGVGAFAAQAVPALAPKFNTFHNVVSPGALIIASMATTAYLAHFNSPDFYHDFQKPASVNGAVVEDETHSRDTAMAKFTKMTNIGFATCTVLNVLVMAFGFLTFGGNCAGVILNNYSTKDTGAAISRLLITTSVVGGYPFMIGGCKQAFVQLYNKFKGESGPQPSLQKWVTRGLLFLTTSLALVLTDAGLVVSLNGALMGSAIVYGFPSLLFLAHTGKQVKAANGRISKRLKMERWANRALLTFGVGAGLIGAGVSIVNKCYPHLLR